MQTPIDFKKVYARLSGWALPFLVVLLLLSLFTCNKQKNTVNALQLNLDSVARQAQTFENERGQLIVENQQLVAENADQLKELTDSIFALKRREEKRIKEVQTYTRVIQQYKARDKFAPFLPIPEDTATTTAGPAPVPTADSNYVRVPRPFMYMDSTVIFAGRVTRAGVWLDSIRIDNTQHIRTLVNKTGFLNLKRTTTVQVVNSNPAIVTAGITQLTIPNRPNWWQRWGKPVAAAILAGVAVDQFNK